MMIAEKLKTHNVKVEVLDKLGEPDRGFADGRSFYYSGSLSAGAWFFAADGHGGGGLIGEEPWTVRILFDENDIVEVLVTSKDTPDELRE